MCCQWDNTPMASNRALQRFWGERMRGGEGRKMIFYTYQNDVVLMPEVSKRRRFDVRKKIKKC